jgi:hypothetical protein
MLSNIAYIYELIIKSILFESMLHFIISICEMIISLPECNGG